MKKWLVALGMTICLLGLTACGQEENTDNALSNEEAQSIVAINMDIVSQIVDGGMEEQILCEPDIVEMVLSQQYQLNEKVSASMLRSAFESYSKALEVMGSIEEIGQLKSNTVKVNALGDPVEGSIVEELIGTNKNADIEIVYEYGKVSAITINIQYTFGENMEKAGLNTLLGMGTVFCVLILISLIISAFGLIPKIQAAFSKKPEKSANEKSVDSTIAQIIEKEELSDDLELVAVISAAIAAFEGTSGDDFVVRSIRRSR